jgi:hypothetical protein
MNRLALFSGFLCAATVALGQSTPAFSGITQNPGKPLAFDNPFAANSGSSAGVAVARPSSPAPFGKIAQRNDFGVENSAVAGQADLDHLFQAPSANAGAHTFFAWNELQQVIPLAPQFGGRAEAIPTQWPNAKFEQIPTQWPNLKLQDVPGERSGPGSGGK